MSSVSALVDHHPVAVQTLGWIVAAIGVGFAPVALMILAIRERRARRHIPWGRHVTVREERP